MLENIANARRRSRLKNGGSVSGRRVLANAMMHEADVQQGIMSES